MSREFSYDDEEEESEETSEEEPEDYWIPGRYDKVNIWWGKGTTFSTFFIILNANPIYGRQYGRQAHEGY